MSHSEKRTDNGIYLINIYILKAVFY